MKLRPIPFALAPGVEKFHCRLEKMSSLVCAPTVAAAPAVTIAKTTTVRTNRIVLIRCLLRGRSRALLVENLRDFVLSLETRNRLPRFAHLARDHGDVELDRSLEVGVACANMILARREREHAG